MHERRSELHSDVESDFRGKAGRIVRRQRHGRRTKQEYASRGRALRYARHGHIVPGDCLRRVIRQRCSPVRTGGQDEREDEKAFHVKNP